jgi:hypothetical protein
MNKELGEFLRDLLLGSTIESKEVQGIDFTDYNDESMQIRLRSHNPFTGSDSWHCLFLPAKNIQMIQKRLTNIQPTLQEMLPDDIFNQPRQWLATIRIKHLLTDEEELTPQQINEKGKAVAAALKGCKPFDNDDVVDRFETVDELDEFNDALREMYDYCDAVRIWVG